jgi:hypothetical protein
LRAKAGSDEVETATDRRPTMMASSQLLTILSTLQIAVLEAAVTTRWLDVNSTAKRICERPDRKGLQGEVIELLCETCLRLGVVIEFSR